MVKIYQTPKYDCDVLVVGAGPGGAALATYLSWNGINVILVDAKKFPRDKVCGDFVGPVAIAELRRLGVNALPDYQKTNIINRAALFLDGKKLIEKDIPRVDHLDNYGRVIPRLQLDHWLVNTADHAGVKIIENCRLKEFQKDAQLVKASCQVGDKELHLTAKLIIGADGSNSTISRILTGEKYPPYHKILAVRAYYDQINGPADRADLFFNAESFPGYYWLFPTGGSSANIGVGMVLETLPKNETHLKVLLSNLLKNDPSLRERIGAGYLQGKVLGWPLSTYNPDFKYCYDRAMLIGDAAGLINSLNGEGIQYALLSGRWAAEVIIEAFEQEDFSERQLGKFKSKVLQEIGYEMTLSTLVIQFIRNRSLNPVWLKLLEIIVHRAIIDPTYADIAGGVLAGLYPANKVLNLNFINKTILQGAIDLGISGARQVIKGPNNMARQAIEIQGFGKDLTQEVLDNPEEYFKWVSGLGRNGFELSKSAFRYLIS